MWWIKTGYVIGYVVHEDKDRLCGASSVRKSGQCGYS